MKRAYVTALAGGDDYVPGVEALGNSLHATGTEVPAIVLVTPSVSPAAREQVAARGWEVREVQPIANPVPDTQHLFARFANVFTKLRAWELSGVDKAVFLDADTIVVRNIDDLFERPRFAAAPDFFLPDRFNSGVMVLEPSADTFQAMLDRLGSEPSYDGGDQGFLNRFYPDWWAMPVAHRLPPGYNLHHFVFQFLSAHPSLRAALEQEVRIVHYTLQKPWMAPTLSGGSSLWWQEYYEAHPEEDAAWKRRIHQLADWSFDSLVAALGGR
jgi:glycogenin glucosyltransferase